MERHIETLAVHAGTPRPGPGEPAVLPMASSTVWRDQGADDYAGILYPRLSNLPAYRQLEGRLCALERGEAAFVTASGMAAISTAILAACAGGHILAARGLYGGSHSFITRDLASYGIAHDLVDAGAPETWRPLSETRAFYVESISNPTMRVADHRAIVRFCRERGITSIVDNTFATPVGFRPLELGYDVVVHSATKYLNGHTDVTAGCVVGSAEKLAAMRALLSHLGGTLAPQACYLLERGIKTLPLRFRAQSAAAGRIAAWLEEHPAVASVSYPGLVGHPDHARAAELFDVMPAMLAVELKGGAEAAARFVERLELFLHAPSLGGVESLATIPARTSHLGMPRAERLAMGVGDGLVRLSIGVEHPDDLLADLAHALAE